ncbi:hypothetical protein [Ideonella sp. A 288]|uniref:hypothetical protein n=1 Tax=Ideonella sp. A 288 TaxID=1962181 RepID=UPI000B4A8E3B|nr:hypothetical protein [Ideonella sp. A 288]
MDKTNPPRSFGVFKPVGHTVLAFEPGPDLQAATDRLHALGFAADAIVRYSPAEMTALVEADRLSASPLASMGQDLNLVEAHGTQAARGCGFLVVESADDASAEAVAGVAQQCHAASAQRYGRFVIEEVAAAAASASQVFESPDRGLDVASVDGRSNPAASIGKPAG